mmetsp:Transcript_71873/g.120232  ORF Transcript_71873/g.120232 Transcript_71873/m.120232 type:complete len:83 (+) Transcript_71873:384-632(+)
MPWAAKEVKHSEQVGTKAMCSQMQLLRSVAAQTPCNIVIDHKGQSMEHSVAWQASINTAEGGGRGYSWAMSTARTLNKGSTR